MNNWWWLVICAAPSLALLMFGLGVWWSREHYYRLKIRECEENIGPDYVRFEQ